METKTTPPAPKRVKVCSRTTDPLAKQVHAIQTRVTALRARGIDANNTVGRGRLPDVLMGIIWTCLGATGIARACRTRYVSLSSFVLKFDKGPSVHQCTFAPAPHPPTCVDFTWERRRFLLETHY